MYKDLVKELSEKYNRSEYLIEFLVDLGMRKYYNIKKVKNSIDEFYT